MPITWNGTKSVLRKQGLLYTKKGKKTLYNEKDVMFTMPRTWGEERKSKSATGMEPMIFRTRKGETKTKKNEYK